MKSTFFAAMFALLLGAAVVVAADKPAADKPATKPSTTQPAINKFCAVEGGDHTVDKDVFVMYKGQKIGFCCADCIKEFNSDPDAYMDKLKARKDGVK
jgi:hypothetical protein